MPMPPRPFTFSCPACGWKKTVAPLSDALSPNEWFSQCPKCPNERLQMTPASKVDVMLIRLERLLGARRQK